MKKKKLSIDLTALNSLFEKFSPQKKCLREIINDNSQAKGNETNPCMYMFLPYCTPLIPQVTHDLWQLAGMSCDEAPLALRPIISDGLP